ncbi:MAG: hypothetical protein K0R99_2993 [Microbacterium sp.]|jgi:hypothetical protein|nr:hypothetical protein [Microbacterium sp.]
MRGKGAYARPRKTSGIAPRAVDGEPVTPADHSVSAPASEGIIAAGLAMTLSRVAAGIESNMFCRSVSLATSQAGQNPVARLTVPRCEQKAG